MVVALHHLIWSYSYRFLESSWAVAVKNYAWLGQWGVAIFFCISVWFLIDKSNSIEGGNPIKHILLKIGSIYKRIWIPFALSIVLIRVVTIMFPGPQLVVDRKVFVTNFLMFGIPLFSYVDGAHWYLPALIYIHLQDLSFFLLHRRR